MQDKHIAFGAVFGFILSRAGATDYDAISGMFRLSDLHLFGVIGIAILVNAIGFALVRKARSKALNGEPITLANKPMTRGLAAGALLFGVGWALSGTCPGTALAQLGEGRLAGAVTFAGILLGVLLERWQRERRLRRQHSDSAQTPQPVAPAVAAGPP